MKIYIILPNEAIVFEQWDMVKRKGLTLDDVYFEEEITGKAAKADLSVLLEDLKAQIWISPPPDRVKAKRAFMGAYFEHRLMENLDERYDLVYVSYDDELTSEQVEYAAQDDIERLQDSIEEWESDSRYIAAGWHFEDILERTSQDFEHHYPGLIGYINGFDYEETVRQEIMDRDQSDPITALAKQTGLTLMRVFVEEATLNGPQDVLDMLGWEATEKNVTELEEALANAWDPRVVQLVFAVEPEKLLAYGNTVTVTNPAVWISTGSGDGWCTDTLEGSYTFERSRLHTDKHGPGYDWNETAGVFASSYEAKITIEQKEEK